MRLKNFFIICFLYLLFNSAHAEIGVTPIIVDFSAGGPDNAEIAVKNFNTQHPAYVEITAYFIKEPGKLNKKIRIADPDKSGLVVFPSKLSLLPGQTQYVRLVKTAKHLSRDKVFEVDFIPKMTTRFLKNNVPNGPAMGIRVIVGYGARVTLRPNHILPSLSVKRINNRLVIKNTGNTQIRISSCTQSIKGKSTEIPLPAYTLFPGNLINKQLTQPTSITLDTLIIDKPFKVFHLD